MPSTLPAAESSLGALQRIADEGLGAQDMLLEAAARIERVVPSDGYFLAATDPETTLCTGTGIVRELPADQCQPHWDYEFLVPDVLKYADIARSGQRVADIHDATGGRPDRSPRFKQYSAATGFRSEVRLVFTVAGAAWGLGQLNRRHGRFSDVEKAWLDRASAVIGRGLRQAMVAQPAASPDRGPGVIVLDGDARVVSATREAVEWLDELDAEMLMSDVGDLALPFHAHGLATRVRAAHEDGEPQIRSRLRTRNGVWLLMHGAVLGGSGQVALIIEPAKSADVAPLLVEAYGLTTRELDVTRAIARGLSTAEVGAALHLSPHTVRDHVKAIFEKCGVSSRGELVHRVFAEHYAAPTH